MNRKQINKLASKYSSKIISLKLAEENDAEFIFNMMQDKEYKKYYMDRLVRNSVEEEKKNIKKLENHAEKGLGYYFIIFYRGQPAGIIEVYKIHKFDKRAAVGYGIAREFWGKGIATKSLKLTLNILKKEFELHATEATTYPKNIRSKKVLEKNGFKKVGKMEQYTYSKDGWKDRLLYWKVL